MALVEDYKIECESTIGSDARFEVVVKKNIVTQLSFPSRYVRTGMVDYNDFKKSKVSIRDNKINLYIRAKCDFEAGSCPQVLAKLKRRDGYDSYDGEIVIKYKDTMIGHEIGNVETSESSCDLLIY